jgi:energy-coupling factor transport system ATP-binding protein
MEDIADLVSKVLVLENSRVAMFGTVEEVYSKREELLKMGLNVPQVTRIFAGLRERGLHINTNIFTVEQGRQELLRFFGKGADL